jgi:tRNA nucleotidyltransferase (CCA-adding enzyme)
MIHNQELLDIVTTLTSAGGKPYLVGGAVRDLVMGTSKPKDLDIEVYGLPVAKIIEILNLFGKVDQVGAAFGVIILKTRKGGDYDVSVPRRESKAGRGHKGFIMEPDPTMTPKEACLRRDFTINSLLYDFEEKNIIDYYGGVKDIQDGVLRHVSSAFAEDPLRVLRGMQFAGRFNMTVAPETAELCRSLIGEYKDLPVERVWTEWEKWATKSVKPSAGLQFLRDTGWIKLYPALEAMIDVPQHPDWHPEGGVWTHVCVHVIDYMQSIAEEMPTEEKTMLMLTALCHDLGKPSTTEYMRDSKDTPGTEAYRSHGHAEAGVELSEKFLTKIGCLRSIIDKVKPLVKYHLAHSNRDMNKRTVRRLAVKLHPASIQELCWLIEADASGRPPKPTGLPEVAQKILDLSQELEITLDKPKPMLMGRMLLKEKLIKPGPAMGKIIAESFQAQLDGVFEDAEGALEWAKEKLQ